MRRYRTLLTFPIRLGESTLDAELVQRGTESCLVYLVNCGVSEERVSLC
jgi:hypothetical protein